MRGAPTRRAVLRNAAMAAAQVIVLGASLFVLYRVVLRAVGVERLGVWSLVLATTSVARLSQLGIGHGVVRYVSRALGREDTAEAREILDTAAAATAALAVAGVLAIYPAARWFASFTVPPALADEAHAVLPWALASLAVALVTGVFEAGLDGMHRMDLRTLTVMTTTLVYVGLAMVLLPTRGLLGLAEAQLAQALLSLAATRAVLARQLPGLGLLPRRVSRARLRELLGFGAAVQAMHLGNLLLEPVTKALVARLGSVAAVGWYEMASRMVWQLRAMAASGAEALVPAMSHLGERDRATMRAGYVDATRAMAFAVIPATGALVAWTPLVSELWIGAWQREFVAFACILALALFPTLVAVPAYFTAIALGRLRPNVVAAAVTLALTAGLGGTLGALAGPLGVAAGFSTALAAGHAIMLVSFHRAEALPIRQVIPAGTGRLSLASAAAAALGLAVHSGLSDRSAPVRAVAVIAVSVSLILPAVWRHPLRRELVAWFLPGAQGGARP